MAKKFHGNIGFATLQETGPGVFVEVITEKTYRGDVQTQSKRWDQASQVNENLVLSHTISIIATQDFRALLPSVRYLKYMGVAWKVVKMEENYPRITLTTGSKYNGV